MVKRLLKLPAAPKADSADALAVAICHAHGGQGLGALATAGFRVGREGWCDVYPLPVAMDGWR